MPALTRSVLVVDDDEDVRDSVALVLREEGYQVETAANGKEALELLDRIPAPAVMLLDLMMPVMSGWQTLEKLRDRPGAPAVVVVSASLTPPPAGVAGYVPKPIDVERLLSQVSELASR